MTEHELMQIHARMLSQHLLLNRLWTNFIAHRPDWKDCFEGNRDTTFRLLENGEAHLNGSGSAYSAEAGQYALSYTERFWEEVGANLDLIFSQDG